jgi:signal transduction histidine kinase
MSLLVNITATDRPAFEATLSRDYGSNITIFSALPPFDAIPASSPYDLVALHEESGNEPAVGFSVVSLGVSITSTNRTKGTPLLAKHYARALAVPPYSDIGIPGFGTLWGFLAPVYVNPSRIGPEWRPHPAADGSFPLIHCANDTDTAFVNCPLGVERNPALLANGSYSDPAVAFVARMNPVLAPLYATVPNSSVEGVAAVLPLEGPATKSGGPWRAPLGMQPRLSISHDQLRIGASEQLFAGVVTGSMYARTMARSVLRSTGLPHMLLAIEDVTADVAGFEFALVTHQLDEAATALPSEVWREMIRQSGGELPALGPTQAPLSVAVPTRAGVVTLRQSAENAALWDYTGAAFGSGDFVVALDARAGVTTATDAEVDAACISAQAFAKRRAESKFTQAFVATIGGRLWHIQVIAPSDYPIDRTTSVFALVGGMQAATILTLLAACLVWNRQRNSKDLQEKAAARAHELIVAYATHECRNPLFAASAVGGLLGDSVQALLALTADEGPVAGLMQHPAALQLRERLSEVAYQMQEDVETLQQSCESMHQVINDLTDMRRLREGKFQLRPRYVQLRALLQHCMTLARPMCAPHVDLCLSVETGLPDVCLLDPLRMQQIITNALTNALKHATRPRDCIRLSAWIVSGVPAAPAAVRPAMEGTERRRDAGRKSPSAIDLSLLPASAWYKGRAPAATGAGAAGVSAAGVTSSTPPYGRPSGRSAGDILVPASSRECSRGFSVGKLMRRRARVVPSSPSAAPAALAATASTVAIGVCGGEAAAGANAPEPGVAMRWLVIEISDTGPGLRGQAGKALFEPFIQGDATVRKLTEPRSPRPLLDGSPLGSPMGALVLPPPAPGCCEPVLAAPNSRVAAPEFSGAGRALGLGLASTTNQALLAGDASARRDELIDAEAQPSLVGPILAGPAADSRRSLNGVQPRVDSVMLPAASVHCAVDVTRAAVEQAPADVKRAAAASCDTPSLRPAGGSFRGLLQEATPRLPRGRSHYAFNGKGSARMQGAAISERDESASSDAGSSRTGPAVSLALQGSGLGLALAGSLVEAMGGHCALCDFGDLTRFIIHIPVPMRVGAPDAGLDGSPADSTREATTSRTVTLVSALPDTEGSARTEFDPLQPAFSAGGPVSPNRPHGNASLAGSGAAVTPSWLPLINSTALLPLRRRDDPGASAGADLAADSAASALATVRQPSSGEASVSFRGGGRAASGSSGARDDGYSFSPDVLLPQPRGLAGMSVAHPRRLSSDGAAGLLWSSNEEAAAPPEAAPFCVGPERPVDAGAATSPATSSATPNTSTRTRHLGSASELPPDSSLHHLPGAVSPLMSTQRRRVSSSSSPHSRQVSPLPLALLRPRPSLMPAAGSAPIGADLDPSHAAAAEAPGVWHKTPSRQRSVDASLGLSYLARPSDARNPHASHMQRSHSTRPPDSARTAGGGSSVLAGDALPSGVRSPEASGAALATVARCAWQCGAPPHVLVAEDDPTNRRLLQRMLQRLRVTCDMVEDGDECEALLISSGQLPWDPAMHAHPRAARSLSTTLPGGPGQSTPLTKRMPSSGAGGAGDGTAMAGADIACGVQPTERPGLTDRSGVAPTGRTDRSGASDELGAPLSVSRCGRLSQRLDAGAAAFPSSSSATLLAGFCGSPLPTPRPFYAAILMDINMVRSRGDTVAAAFKRRGLAIPIVPMTANTSEADVARYRAAGMSEQVLGKPFTSDALLAVLQMADAQAFATRSAAAAAAGLPGSSSTGTGIAVFPVAGVSPTTLT